MNSNNSHRNSVSTTHQHKHSSHKHHTHKQSGTNPNGSVQQHKNQNQQHKATTATPVHRHSVHQTPTKASQKGVLNLNPSLNQNQQQRSNDLQDSYTQQPHPLLSTPTKRIDLSHLGNPVQQSTPSRNTPQKQQQGNSVARQSLSRAFFTHNSPHHNSPHKSQQSPRPLGFTLNTTANNDFSSPVFDIEDNYVSPAAHFVAKTTKSQDIAHNNKNTPKPHVNNNKNHINKREESGDDSGDLFDTSHSNKSKSFEKKAITKPVVQKPVEKKKSSEKKAADIEFIAVASPVTSSQKSTLTPQTKASPAKVSSPVLSAETTPQNPAARLSGKVPSPASASKVVNKSPKGATPVIKLSKATKTAVASRLNRLLQSDLVDPAVDRSVPRSSRSKSVVVKKINEIIINPSPARVTKKKSISTSSTSQKEEVGGKVSRSGKKSSEKGSQSETGLPRSYLRGDKVYYYKELPQDFSRKPVASLVNSKEHVEIDLFDDDFETESPQPKKQSKGAQKIAAPKSKTTPVKSKASKSSKSASTDEGLGITTLSPTKSASSKSEKEEKPQGKSPGRPPKVKRTNFSESEFDSEKSVQLPAAKKLVVTKPVKTDIDSDSDIELFDSAPPKRRGRPVSSAKKVETAAVGKRKSIEEHPVATKTQRGTRGNKQSKQ